MSIDEADALAEEDLSDEALETSDDLTRSMTLIERAAAETTAAGDLVLAPGPTALSEMGFGPGMTAGLSGPKPDADGWRRVSTSAGDVVDADTGEVLEDAPGYDPSTRTILNNEGCDWAGGRLREKREALDECHRMYDAEVKRIQEQCDRLMAAAEARLAKATAPLHRDADFLENVIRAYAETHRAELLRGLRKGAKSRTFPSGLKLAWRTEAKGGVYRWDEKMKPAEREAALLAWAQDYDARLGTEFVEKRPALKPLAVVTKHLNAHHPRQEVPGLEYVPEHEELKIAVEDDK